MERLELHRVSLALREPFEAAHGVTDQRDLILVAACGGGLVGWGECPTLSTPGYSDETTDAAWEWLRGGGAAGLARRHEGRPLAGARVPAGPIPRMASGAVLDAIRDLKERRTPALESADLPTELESTAVIGRRAAIDDLVVAVGREVGDGVRHVKLKIAPGWDVEPLGAVRRTWPALDLAADANGSYELVDLPRLASLATFGLRYLEQPLSPIAWHRFGTQWPADAPPVALDESVLSAADARELALAGNVSFVNVKPARLGGGTRARPVAELLEVLGVGVFVGGMLETGVGRATALRFAASLGTLLPTDLGPSSRYFDDDVTEPIGWSRPGWVEVPHGPGVGRVPRPERLAACTTDALVVHL